MEGRRFLVITEDEKEQTNIKEKCKEMGYRVACIDTPHNAMKYIPYFTDFDFMIIDVDLPNDDAILFCRKIRNESPKTFIIGLKSSEEREREINHIFDALLFKPLHNNNQT